MKASKELIGQATQFVHRVDSLLNSTVTNGIRLAVGRALGKTTTINTTNSGGAVSEAEQPPADTAGKKPTTDGGLNQPAQRHAEKRSTDGGGGFALTVNYSWTADDFANFTPEQMMAVANLLAAIKTLNGT